MPRTETEILTDLVKTIRELRCTAPEEIVETTGEDPDTWLGPFDESHYSGDPAYGDGYEHVNWPNLTILADEAEKVLSPGENYILNEKGHYWSNYGGWTDYPEKATIFSDAEVKGFDLPMGGVWKQLRAPVKAKEAPDA